MTGFITGLILSLFLDEEGRRALARREHVSHLDDELKIEMAKTNALIASLNKQNSQVLGVSEERQAKVAGALESQARTQEALSHLDPETRRHMIDRSSADEASKKANDQAAGKHGRAAVGSV